MGLKLERILLFFLIAALAVAEIAGWMYLNERSKARPPELSLGAVSGVIQDK